jgi:hypothetical protein
LFENLEDTTYLSYLRMDKSKEPRSSVKSAKNKMNYAIIAFTSNETELGYWIGADYNNPDSSIGQPVNWGTIIESTDEMEVAAKFAIKQGWEVIFKLTNWS